MNTSFLEPSMNRSFCEWKGEASYFDAVVDGERIEQAAWSYESPTADFEPIRGCLAFYAQKVSCSVAGEAVIANDGTFYGGWITSNIVGPFKGGPGTAWW